jgi:flagellin
MGSAALNLQTNVASLSAQRNLQRNEHSLMTSMSRLSSGLRINMAADDAAGLAISEKLRASVRGLGQAQRNANDGVSLLQTAEGALNEVSDMLIRIRELAVQSANGTLGDGERVSLHDEFRQLREEINRIADVTEFAGLKLLNGAQAIGMTFQVGIGNKTNDRITVSLADSHVSQLWTSGTANMNGDTISTVAGARATMSHVDSAINAINRRRGVIGAKQNRLFTTINNLSSQHENLSAANSRIRDADVASETANFARTQILMQAGISVLSQANQFPAMALALVTGR